MGHGDTVACAHYVSLQSASVIVGRVKAWVRRLLGVWPAANID